MSDHERDTKFSILDFGAVGDGVKDCTEAIQAALDEAAKVEGTVVIPAGKFLTGELRVGTGVVVEGATGFEYTHPRGSKLMMRDDGTSAGLLNLSDSRGCELRGFCVNGLGREPEQRIIHGIFVDKPSHKEMRGMCIFIDHVRVEGFSGCAVYMQNTGVITIRHSYLCGSGQDGIRGHFWDGWLIDNWLSGNTGAGFRSIESSASITMTGNRIEWNDLGGIVMRNAYRFNITGNTIDWSGECAIDLRDCENIVMTGNMLWRSGRPFHEVTDPYQLAHVRFRNVAGSTFVGNSMFADMETHKGNIIGGNDIAPKYGMVLENLRTCVIQGNSLWQGAALESIKDFGGHDGQTVIRDNACSLAVPPPGR